MPLGHSGGLGRLDISDILLGLGVYPSQRASSP